MIPVKNFQKWRFDSFYNQQWMMNSCELPAKKGDVHPEKLGCQAKNSIAKAVV